MLGCANDPISKIPQDTVATSSTSVAQYGGEGSQVVDVQTMLAAIRQPGAKNTATGSSVPTTPDLIVTLHYNEHQQLLLPSQQQELIALLALFEGPLEKALLHIYAGPGSTTPSLEMMHQVQQRAWHLESFLAENGAKSVTNYDPHLPEGFVIVQLVELGEGKKVK